MMAAEMLESPNEIQMCIHLQTIRNNLHAQKLGSHRKRGRRMRIEKWQTVPVADGVLLEECL